MFPAKEFKQAKTSTFYSKAVAKPKVEHNNTIIDIQEQEEKKSSYAILEKLESICEKLAKNDTLVAEFKQKQDELFKAFEKKEPYFPAKTETQETQIPNSNFVSSVVASQQQMYAQPLQPTFAPQQQQDEKKKKKTYKKLTPDLVEKVYDRYPQFPKDVKELYTTDGEDLYALHKNKKVPIENLGSVLALIK